LSAKELEELRKIVDSAILKEKMIDFIIKSTILNHSLNLLSLVIRKKNASVQ
jgi:hypothetical protein